MASLQRAVAVLLLPALTALGVLLPGTAPGPARAADDAVEIGAYQLPAPESVGADPAEPESALAGEAALQSGSSEPPPGEVPAQPDSVKPHLSLSRAIELALAQSPGLDAMHWQSQALWEQAESVLGHGRLKSSFSILGLQTTAPLGVFAYKLSQGSVSQADFNPAVLNDPDPYGNIEYQLRLVYPLFSSERIELLASALRLNAEAVSLDRIRAEHELEGRVIETYLAHDLLEEQLAVLDDTRLTIAALTRSIESLHREGLVIGADLAAAQVEASKLEDELNKAGAQLAMTENLIAILTGAEPGFSSELDLSALEPGLPELEELYQTALESRPDLRALQSRVAAAGAMLEEATRNRRPEIGAFAEGKHSTPDLPGNGHTELTVGAQLSIDLDTGGVLKNEVQQKRSELNAARKGLEQLEQMAKMDVAVAWSELDSALGSRESLRSQSDKTAENLRVVTNRYGEGLTNYLDVRMAVSSHKESRLRSLQADYDAALAYMRLLSACGRIGSADDPFLGGLVSAAPEEAAVLHQGGAEAQQAQSTGMQQWGEN